MVFSSFVFAGMFFPLVYVVNRCLPTKISNLFLLTASLFLYAWGESVFVILLIGCTLANYLLAMLITKHRRAGLLLTLIVNLGLLCAFKYADFLIGNLNALTGLSIPLPHLRMPIGISFFTFQAMSYTLDVYRGECRVQKSFLRLLLYVSLFPQLIAGPIVKYHEMEQYLTERHADARSTALGARRFIVGFAKKILLANTLAITADKVFTADASLLNMPVAWLGAVCYAMQIYFDFSGYSDMAIGMGNMMGFGFPENFRYPYAASSMKDFWRRWHISLSSWFRDYVYIPLGGNRKGNTRAIVNRLIVFFLTGLWHGANWTFVIWGLGNGFLLLLEGSGLLPVQKLKGKAKVLGHVYVWLSFLLLFVIFRSETIAQAFEVYRGMFLGFGMTDAQRLLLAQCLNGTTVLTLAAAVICAFPWKERLEYVKGRPARVLYIGSFIVCLGLLWCALMALASQSYNPFIYFRF